MTDNNNVIDRRRALKLLGSTAAVTSLAGCFDNGGGTPTGGDDGTPTPSETPTDTPTPSPTESPTDTPTATSVEAPAAPEYLEWVPDTSLLGNSLPLFPFRLAPAKFEENEDKLNSEAESVIFRLTAFPGGRLPLSNSDMTEIIGGRGVFVVRGDFTQREVITGAADRFEVKSPEYEDFVITADTEENEVIAAIDGIAIAIQDVPKSEDLREVATKVIDTGLGNFRRLTEEQPRIKPLAGWVGTQDLTSLEIHEPYESQQPSGKMGHGLGWSLANDGLNGKLAIQFESAQQATDDAVSAAIQNDLPVAQTWTNTTQTQRGSIVVIEGDVSSDTFLKTGE